MRNGNAPDDAVAFAGYMAEFRQFLPVGQARLVSHLPTCNISYRRAIFERYGTFPPDCYPQEDLVFHTHLAEKGIHILMDPSVCVFHTHRSRVRDFMRHQVSTGRVTARVLGRVALQGSFIVRNPVAFAPLVPLLPAVKFIRTIGVFVRHLPLAVLRRPGACALLAVGLCAWGVGFAGALYGGSDR